tara:strand:- start:4061 stop:4816 length:756 start_codon:yes stop_codon:yes gene_type:complete
MVTTEEIFQLAKKVAIGMSKNQIDDFVIKSHVTGDRQLKQVMLEIENRLHNFEKMKIGKRKSVLAVKIAEDRLTNASNNFEKEEAEIEVDDAKLDLEMWERRINQLQYELNVFVDHIQEHIETIEELETASEWNEEEERKYWIARMGKQAALDLMANGRVGTGNLDSIAMMKQEDQIAILDVASQYSCLMKLSMDKITGRTEKYFKAYAESPDVDIPTFHGIEETMNVPLLDQIKDEINAKYLQSTDQSEE